MDLATGAIASLLPKLVELLHEEYKLPTSVKKDVEFLEREMKSQDAALRKVASVPREQLNDQVKIWADQVRELSYEMEDLVDSFLVRVEGPTPAADHPDRFMGLMKKMTNLFKSKTRHKIADAIQDIMNQAREVAALRERYKVDDAGANPSTTTTVDPRMASLFKEQRELIGIDGPRDEIIKRITEEDVDISNYKQQLKILSIFGFGGLGKTTLAKAVYDKLQGEFVGMAFVSLGQNPNLKKVLLDILRQLDKDSYISATMLDEQQLIRELRRLLDDRRYLIVIDDVWDLKSWELIKAAWVDSKCASVIITTTRILKVAEEITDDVYKHKPLSDDKSRELFFKILSIMSKGKHSYDQSAAISEKILLKCGGVPLAIVTIASSLASKHMEDWSKVYDSIGFGDEYNLQVEKTRKILLYSYYDLPYHLRTCLLYLRIYPEDYKIEKRTLIWKWVAEGFVHDKHIGVGLFELGERYFNELINRSMIQPIVELQSGGLIYACHVHDLVLDMINYLSKEENFVVVLGSDEQHRYFERNARRLAIQNKVIDEHYPMANTPMPQLRSFNATTCQLGMMPSLLIFHSLRVVALEACTFMNGRPYHLKHLGKLLQLRYLKLSDMPITELPSEIGNLKFLQTLNLRGTKISKLPPSVGLLSQLKCLHISDHRKVVSDWFGNLTCMEELEMWDVCEESVKHLGKLIELRILSIHCYVPDVGLVNSVLASLGNMHKLQTFRVDSVLPCADECVYFEDVCVASRHLRSVVLDGPAFARLPAWLDPLLIPHLSHLELTVEPQDWEILGRFPELSSLKLKTTTFGYLVPDIIGGGAFPKLRYFEVNAMLRFLTGAMPSVECIKYRIGDYDGCDDCSLKSDIATIGNLPCLQEVEFRVSSPASQMWKETANEALRHAVEIHPKRPTLKMW